MISPEPLLPALRSVWLLWRRCGWRHWRTAPGQTAALAGVIAAGVAVFLAVRLANAAALAGFQDFAGLLGADPDWMVSATAGTLPESVLPEIRSVLGSRPVLLTPVVETSAARPRAGGADRIGERGTYTVVGLDLISLLNTASLRPGAFVVVGTNVGTEPYGVWGPPGGVLIGEALALREGLSRGARISLIVQDRLVDLEVTGVIPAQSAQPNPATRWLLMDLPVAQGLAGKVGRVDRVEVSVEEGPDRAGRREQVRRLLEQAGGGRWLVTSPADRREAAATMTRAFRFNLTLLSLLALVVGAGLVFQALDAAVLRRREEIASLGALGVSPGVIRGAMLLESALLGLVGGLAGVPLGWGAGQAALVFVGRTVNALYHATDTTTAPLRVGEAALAVGAAVVSSLVAGWRPARLAAQTPPAQLLGRSVSAPRRSAPWPLFGAAALCVALALAAGEIPPFRAGAAFRVAVGGYAALAAWATAGALVAGATLAWFGAAGAPCAAGNPASRMASGYLRFPTTRHRLAAASVAAAVGMTAGMAVLVSSFDLTMRRWIESVFQADLYLASDGAQGASSRNRLPSSTWRALAADPATADVIVTQVLDLETPGGATTLVGTDLETALRRGTLLWLLPPQPGDRGGTDAVAVSESFASRFLVSRGDSLSLPLPGGGWTGRILGVYADYGNERGSVMIERAKLARRLADDSAATMTVFLNPGVDPEAVRARWQAERPGLRIFANAHLRSEVLRIFGQTFAITYALEAVGLAAAAGGLALTLLSVFLERRSDLAALRALGFTRRDIAAMAAAEGGVLGGVAALAGAAAGVAMGWVLVHVVNRQTFGWTLQFKVPAGGVALLVAAVGLVGGAAAWAAGLWAARLPADSEE